MACTPRARNEPLQSAKRDGIGGASGHGLCQGEKSHLHSVSVVGADVEVHRLSIDQVNVWTAKLMRDLARRTFDCHKHGHDEVSEAESSRPARRGDRESHESARLVDWLP